MNASERIKKLTEYLDKGSVTIAIEAGLPRTRIIDIEHKRVKKITYDTADAICRKFPTISCEWLLTGEGEMLVSVEEKPIPESANVPLDLRYAINELLAIVKNQQEQIAQLLSRDEEFLNRHAEDVEIMRELLKNYRYQHGSSTNLVSDKPPVEDK